MPRKRRSVGKARRKSEMVEKIAHDMTEHWQRLGAKVEAVEGLPRAYVVTNIPKPPPVEWYRIGGRRFEFCALDSEIEKWLSEDLPDEYAPYSIIVAGQLRNYPVRSFRKLRRAGQTQFYLRGHKLTPDLDKARRPFIGEYADHCEVQLGYAGLIMLQLDYLRNPGPHWFSLIEKVCHVPANEVQVRQEYRPLFNFLKRHLRKQLVHWASLKHHAGGVETWKRPMVDGESCAQRTAEMSVEDSQGEVGCWLLFAVGDGLM